MIKFLDSEPLVEEMFRDLCHFLEKWLPRFRGNNRPYTTIAIGCTGGQHRSVYLSERLKAHFSSRCEEVQVRHRELDGSKRDAKLAD